MSVWFWQGKRCPSCGQRPDQVDELHSALKELVEANDACNTASDSETREAVRRYEAALERARGLV